MSLKNKLDQIKKESINGFHDGSLCELNYCFEKRNLTLVIENCVYDEGANKDDIYKNTFNFANVGLLNIKGLENINGSDFSDEISSFNCDSDNIFKIVIVDGSVVTFDSNSFEYNVIKTGEYKY